MPDLSIILSRVVGEQDPVICLTRALVAVSALALMALGIVGVLVYRGTPIHVVYPGQNGVSAADELPDTFVQDVAMDIVERRYSWVHDQIDRFHARFKAKLHPRLVKYFEQEVMPQEKKLVKEHKIGSMVVVTDVTITQRKDYKRQVVVTAVRYLWLGGTPRDPEDIQMTLNLVPWPTNSLKDGLRIWAMHDTPLRVATK